MKNSWQILTLLLAVALVALTLKDLRSGGSSDPQAAPVDKTQVALDMIMSRSSVRSYTSQPVEQDKIETILKAAMAAPTAGNRQPWEFIVISDREIIDQFPGILAGAHMAGKAQTAIAVCGTPDAALRPGYWIQDCSAATENALLAAHALGLGAVWCGAYPNDNNDRVEQMSALLSLPEGTLALSLIFVGYPDTEPVVKDKWQPSKVHYNTF